MHHLGIQKVNFVVYPVFYSCIPSMLKWIGLGFFLIMLSFLSSSVIELIQLISNTLSNITCATINRSSIFDPIEINWILLFPVILHCISSTPVTYAALEFFIAQSPLKIKGFILCLLAGYMSSFGYIGFFTRKIIKLYPINVSPGCAFYYHIIYFILITAVFTLYALISKWYSWEREVTFCPFTCCLLS